MILLMIKIFLSWEKPKSAYVLLGFFGYMISSRIVLLFLSYQYKYK